MIDWPITRTIFFFCRETHGMHFNTCTVKKSTWEGSALFCSQYIANWYRMMWNHVFSDFITHSHTAKMVNFYLRTSACFHLRCEASLCPLSSSLQNHIFHGNFFFLQNSQTEESVQWNIPQLTWNTWNTHFYGCAQPWEATHSGAIFQLQHTKHFTLEIDSIRNFSQRNIGKKVCGFQNNETEFVYVQAFWSSPGTRWLPNHSKTMFTVRLQWAQFPDLTWTVSHKGTRSGPMVFIVECGKTQQRKTAQEPFAVDSVHCRKLGQKRHILKRNMRRYWKIFDFAAINTSRVRFAGSRTF